MQQAQKTPVLRTIHTGLTVSSLDDAIAFWCGVMGFELSTRKNLGSGAANENIVGVPGADIEIAVVTGPGGSKDLQTEVVRRGLRAPDFRRLRPGRNARSRRGSWVDAPGNPADRPHWHKSDLRAGS
jgi:catechol 2,3-dioxygenase-like lactoylglutathione lyase family enzyme